MINAFGQWLMESWNTIVEILMWIISILSIFFVISVVYKALRVSTQPSDYVGLILALGWGFLIIYFGFDQVRGALQSLL